MNKTELLARIAPCSLLCHTCGGYEHGVLHELSSQLLHYTQGMTEFKATYSAESAQRFAAFRAQLGRLCNTGCGGCRTGRTPGCCIEGCFVPDCAQAHGVDFCGQCAEFPCEKPRTFFEPIVYEQWLRGGEEIRQKGIVAYWEAHKSTPHYLPYIRKNGKQ